jgi:hypothetical protein
MISYSEHLTSVPLAASIFSYKLVIYTSAIGRKFECPACRRENSSQIKTC